MVKTAIEAVGLQFKEAVEFFRQKARVPTSHWTDVWRTAHSRSFMVAGATSDALLSDFQTAIRKALEQGTTLETFRKDFDAIVARHGWDYNGSRNWRSQIIYETNLSTAYSAGRYAQLTEPGTIDIFPYWRYVHSGARHPRLQHLAWNGLTLRADDPFWRTHYPPNGWRCGCRVAPVTEAGLERMGKSGPDKAPPIETREWRNPKTGEVHDVPVGIDPGWDYNPGMAWKEGGKEIPVQPPRVVSADPTRPSVRPKYYPAVGEAEAELSEGMTGWTEGLSAAETDAVSAAMKPEADLTQEQVEKLRQALGRARLPEAARADIDLSAVEIGGLREMTLGDIWQPPRALPAKVAVGAVKADAPARQVRVLIGKHQRGAAWIDKAGMILLAPGIGLRRVRQLGEPEQLLLEAVPMEEDT